MSIKSYFNKPVTIGFFTKLIICMNIVILIYCMRISDIRLTEDKEHRNEDQEMMNYINVLEESLDIHREYIKILQNRCGINIENV